MRDTIIRWTSLSAQRWPSCHKNRDKQPAFTLLEVLVVTCLVVIIAAISIPSLLRNDNGVPAQLEDIEAVCSYLQQRAIASNRNQELCIDVTAHTYSYAIGEKRQTFPLHHNILFGFSGSVLGPPANPEGPITTACTFPKRDKLHVMTFYPTGIISAGTIYFIDKQKRHLGALTSSVSQVSYIRRYCYTNNKWTPVSA